MSSSHGDGDADVAGVGVAGDVRQRLAQHRYEMLGDEIVDGVDRPVELQPRFEAEAAGRVGERA